MRIVAEFLGRNGRTATELQECLGDIPPATLYRHLTLLSDAGFLAVRETRAKRGAHEKTYVLAVEPLVSVNGFVKSPSRCLQTVTTYAAMILGDFTRYISLARRAKRAADPVLRAYAILSTDAEFRALTASLENSLAQAEAAGSRAAAAGRKRRLFYLAAIPDVEGDS